MSNYAIQQYHKGLEKIIHYGGTKKETAIRNSFYNLLNEEPSDPTIAEKFNTDRFADYKEQVIDLLARVCTVRVETMKIIEQMPKE